MTDDTESCYTIARANLGSRSRQTGEADGLLGALDDFAGNKIALSVRERIFQARQTVTDAISERDGLKGEIIQQYDDTGQGWENPEDAPEKVLEEIGELMADVVSLDLGDPVVVNGDNEDLQFDDDRNFQILREIGWLEIKADE